jgi:hypothetical protein
LICADHRIGTATTTRRPFPFWLPRSRRVQHSAMKTKPTAAKSKKSKLKDMKPKKNAKGADCYGCLAIV